MRDKYMKANKISLEKESDLNERWVQDLIENDPSILGLGDLVVRDRERRQLRAGRLDLLLEDSNGKRRYEVELQLGSTDESHIIRSIEYWDIEKKLYPYYEHSAVLVAENITSRFLNVISLFNGTVPFIAIQMGAYQIDDKVTLVFTKVMDEIRRGPADDYTDAKAGRANREYWNNKATEEMLTLADLILKIIRDIDPKLELNYNKPYIGLKKGSMSCNFVTLVPQKKSFIFRLYLPQNEDVDKIIEDSELEKTDSSDDRHYAIRLTQDEVQSKSETLKDLSKRAYDHRFSA